MAKAYGLRKGQYEELLASQGGACAICHKATGRTKRLAVDHDHKTGYVRGILCGPCNRLLGVARDDVNFFIRAIDYLINPPAHQTIGKVRPDNEVH